MKVAACTLFEGSYHLGVAVLIQSLVRAGFAGVFYVGYRGALPPWAEGRQAFYVTDSLEVRFRLVETEAHLTNYKPEFLRTLLSEDLETIVYFDPDIVVQEKWRYFEEWLTCGVTLCEDSNSPIWQNHPRRVGWRRFFGEKGFEMKFQEAAFANAGFIGLSKERVALLTRWQDMLAEILKYMGGSQFAKIPGGKPLSEEKGFADCFDQTDQDALNAALEAVPGLPISFLGRTAMGFESGKSILPHAIGAGKPWERPYLRYALRGIPPRAVDKAFWECASGALNPFPAAVVRNKRLELRIAAAIGRFVRRA